MAAYVIIGLIQGAIIGLLAIGIVLIYKGARVFNFAQAEFGTLAAYFLYFFARALHLPYLIGIVFALITAGVVGFALERLIVRPLFNAPRVTLLVATAGVALLAIGLELKVGGYRALSVPPIIKGNLTKNPILGAAVTWQEVVIVLALGGVAVGLAYFFNRTDMGLAVLATSQEPVATELVGIGTKRMSTFIWVFAAVLGGLAGVLEAAVNPFAPGFMTVNYLLIAFTAAVVGGITSLAGAFVGGMAIGVIQSVANYAGSQWLHSKIPGFDGLMVFVVLIAVLTTRPSGLLGKEA